MVDTFTTANQRDLIVLKGTMVRMVGVGATARPPPPAWLAGAYALWSAEVPEGERPRTGVMSGFLAELARQYGVNCRENSRRAVPSHVTQQVITMVRCPASRLTRPCCGPRTVSSASSTY